jgi:hypothetical protein|tara:strand:- start:348 stop:524 length:177 start_codon:yes stop_codon:yes gene_type:complete
MRQNGRADSWKSKEIARRKYAERQLEKFIKWSIESKGYLKYKELIEYQEKYKTQNERK